MKLSPAIEAYIAHKRSLGMGFRGEAVRLRASLKAWATAIYRGFVPRPSAGIWMGMGG